jgi:hypothetical protein
MSGKTPKNFFESPLGLVLIFVVVFYAMTFAVYYFYSPGPEERNQADLDTKQLQDQAVTLGEQKASVTVTVDGGISQQLATQEGSSQQITGGTQQSRVMGTQESTQQSGELGGGV